MLTTTGVWPGKEIMGESLSPGGQRRAQDLRIFLKT